MRTFARREGDEYVVNGQKIWTSRAEHSDLMLLLARTTAREQVKKKTEGLSTLIVDIRDVVGKSLTIRPIRTLMNHATCEVFFDNMRVPAANLLGEEGQGFRYILSGMNAERVLIAAECIGDAKWFTKKSVAYANERQVFDRTIGSNQGVQFPIARAYAQMRAAELMVREAARLHEAGEPMGAEGQYGQDVGGRGFVGNTWITRISTFCSSRCVAKLCRSVYGDTRLAMPARFLAACEGVRHRQPAHDAAGRAGQGAAGSLRNALPAVARQRGDGGVDGPWADLLLRHMQLKAAKVLARRRIRRSAEEGCEGSDVPDVILLHGSSSP